VQAGRADETALGFFVLPVRISRAIRRPEASLGELLAEEKPADADERRDEKHDNDHDEQSCPNPLF
jgi:hypothetical protein